MCESKIASRGWRQHGSWPLALLALLVFATGAGAEPGGQSLNMPAGAGEPSPSSQVATVAGNGPVAASMAASAPAPETAVPRAACLKEGEACNPLNDLCCPGYYCPGGLARTCGPKP